MSYVERHKVDGSHTDDLTIERSDTLGPGGAPHRYDITGFDTTNNPFSEGKGGYASHFSRLPIIFQAGKVKDKGVNGITFETLLSIVEDGLQHYQSGPYPCKENAIALVHVQAALDSLHTRTRDRMKRQVEGQLTK